MAAIIVFCALVSIKRLWNNYSNLTGVNKFRELNANQKLNLVIHFTSLLLSIGFIWTFIAQSLDNTAMTIVMACICEVLVFALQIQFCTIVFKSWLESTQLSKTSVSLIPIVTWIVPSFLYIAVFSISVSYSTENATNSWTVPITFHILFQCSRVIVSIASTIILVQIPEWSLIKSFHERIVV